MLVVMLAVVYVEVWFSVGALDQERTGELRGGGGIYFYHLPSQLERSQKPVTLYTKDRKSVVCRG